MPKPRALDIELRTRDQDAGELTAEEAKKLLGWSEPGEGLPEDYDGEVHFRYRLNGTTHKVVLKNSLENRPFRKSLADRYKTKIKRKVWAGQQGSGISTITGETCVFSSKGQALSAQHRLVGFVLAELERQGDVEGHKTRFGLSGPITFPCLLVKGVDPKAGDFVDLGQGHTTSDVLYRRHEFGKDVTDRERKQLSRTLAAAARLVWLRSQGLNASAGKRFDHEDMLLFLADHPRIKDAVEFIVTENGGRGAEGQRITALVSMAFAAAMMYLMATDESQASYDEDKEVIKFQLDAASWEKAEEFFVKLASGEGLKSGHPILTLRNALPKTEQGSAVGRDTVLGMFAKAWVAFQAGDDLSGKELSIKRRKITSDSGIEKFVLAEDPRVGGVDLSMEFVDQLTPEPVKADTGWKVGDTCWVNDPDGVQFASITEVHEKEVGVHYEDESQWLVPVAWISEDKPGEEE